jgi:zinc protease
MNLRKTGLIALVALCASWTAMASDIQTEEPTAEQVIENYLQAIGGESNLRNIKTARLEMVAEFQGMVINMFFTHDDENERMNQKVMVMGNQASNITVKDGKAVVSGMGMDQTLTDEQYEEARMNMFIFPELHYSEMGYELSHEGTQDINGEKAHKIKVKNATGASVTNFYSVDSGLKVKSVNETAGDTFYSNYKEFEGVKYPTSLAVKSPMLPEAMKASVETVDFNAEVSDEDFE